jgi:hypothetical protein
MTDHSELRSLLASLVGGAQRLDQLLAGNKPVPLLVLARLAIDVQQAARTLADHADALTNTNNPARPEGRRP